MIALLAMAALADDTVDALRVELDRASALSLPGEPSPYYIRFGLHEHDSTWATAELGGIIRSGSDPSRTLDIELRVGTPELDNGNFGRPWESNGFESVTLCDVRPDPMVDRQDAWRIVDEAYKGALEALARRQASRARLDGVDLPPSFEVREPWRRADSRGTPVEEEAAVAVVRPLSAIFLEHPEIEWSRATLRARGGARGVDRHRRHGRAGPRRTGRRAGGRRGARRRRPLRARSPPVHRSDDRGAGRARRHARGGRGPRRHPWRHGRRCPWPRKSTSGR